MDALQQQLVVLGLRAASDYGFALAGGYAVSAHRVVERSSDDVDLFTSWDRRDEVPIAAGRVAAAYREAGLTVEAREPNRHFVRLLVTDPDGRTPVPAGKVELAADLRLRPTVETSFGPTLHLDDVAAGKVSALFARGAARDYLDVAGLVTGGHYSREALLNLAAERDAGFDHTVFAQMLAGIHRYKDEDFLRYGISPALLSSVRSETDHWRRELTETDSP